MITWAIAFSLLGTLEMRQGTILVLENSHPVVEFCTRSEVSHVGMLLQDNEGWTVYEATPSVVRKLPLSEYYAEIGEMNRRRDADERITMRLYSPNRTYSDRELATLRSYLESQLGRRYSVRGYFRNRPGDGIHCAEMISTALNRTGRYQFPPNYTVSPGELVAQIKPSHQLVESAVPVSLPEGSWCERSWDWWSGFFNWCGWACWETYAICR